MSSTRLCTYAHVGYTIEKHINPLSLVSEGFDDKKHVRILDHVDTQLLHFCFLLYTYDTTQKTT